MWGPFYDAKDTYVDNLSRGQQQALLVEDHLASAISYVLPQYRTNLIKLWYTLVTQTQ